VLVYYVACGELTLIVPCRQMLWWGMDETLVELFTRHFSADGFDCNPMDEFRATIGKEEYGPNETPMTIGLYGGQYTVRFFPGEYHGRQCEWVVVRVLTHFFVRHGLLGPQDIQ